ncbi:DNA repair protein XRCC3-like [Arctopsyche grandis]|uniref:DNA repair protein XRCC3-like n=1 Tax=Arctopsyche grandis TaxID=121162 RepID=UPI00406D95A2
MSKDVNLKPEQIVLMSDYELLKIKGLSGEDLSKLKVNAANNLLPNGFKTVVEMGKSQSKISTGCPHIDKILNGGLDRKCITEIYGESGCGKTQFALQIATNSWNTGVVYLCTEDVFPSKRLHQLFEFINPKYKNMDLSKYGEKIFILQITEVDDLIKCINIQLPCLLESNKSISVVIVDSVAAPFRGDYQEMSSNLSRAQHLKEVGIGLLKCAKSYNLAVLCINQVSSNLAASSTNSIIPCLGLVWSNMITVRINVRKTNKYFRINHELYKNNIIKEIKSLEEKTDSKQLMELNIREFQVMFSPDIYNDEVINYIIVTKGIMSLMNC